MGMGGGTILILLLTIFMGLNQHTAQATNLFFFIPTAIVAIIINMKQKTINLKLGSLIGIVGGIAAIFGAVISLKMDSSSLKKYFGIFLSFITINEIYSFTKKYILNKNRHTINK